MKTKPWKAEKKIIMLYRGYGSDDDSDDNFEDIENLTINQVFELHPVTQSIFTNTDLKLLRGEKISNSPYRSSTFGIRLVFKVKDSIPLIATEYYGLNRPNINRSIKNAILLHLIHTKDFDEYVLEYALNDDNLRTYLLEKDRFYTLMKNKNFNTFVSGFLGKNYDSKFDTLRTNFVEINQELLNPDNSSSLLEDVVSGFKENIKT